jgi:hypothetical protein
MSKLSHGRDDGGPSGSSSDPLYQHLYSSYMDCRHDLDRMTALCDKQNEVITKAKANIDDIHRAYLDAIKMNMALSISFFISFTANIILLLWLL